MSSSIHSKSQKLPIRHSTFNRLNKQSAASSSLVATADAALKLVSQIETKLELDAVSPPIEPKLARAVSRVSAEALTIAAGIVSSDPQRFHDFDATVIGDAAEQVRVLTPVLERVEALVRDLQKSLYKRRERGARQTRALYATLQGLGRLVGSGQLNAQVEKLSAALVPQRKRRKLTAEQKTERTIARNKAKRLTKAKAKLAELEPSPAPIPAPSPPPTPAAASAAGTPTGMMVTVSGNGIAH